MEPTVDDAPAPSAARPLGVEDSIRARELYKYYKPTQNFVASQSSAPDTVLTAYAQLVAWRLNAQRSLVSLIDKETQYFVAESTKTLSLDDSTLHDDPEDAIWAGCINVPKAGRLCEHTLQTIPSPDGSPACFEVLDLSQDPRFSELPFVAGPPYFRYYAGVPIRTKKGVNIGSIFGMDVVAREPLSKPNKLFLTTMATNVMIHLEMMKEKEERKKALNMNACLAEFVNPEHQRKRRRTSSGTPPPRGSHRGTSQKSTEDSPSVKSGRSPLGPDQDARLPLNGSSKVAARSRKKGPSSESRSSPETAVQENGIAGTSPMKHREKLIQEDGAAEHSESKYSSRTDSDTPLQERVDENDHLYTFQRAAQLLYDSLPLNNRGGVVFFDTMTSTQNDTDDAENHLNQNTRSDVRFQYESQETSGNHLLRHVPTLFSDRHPRRSGVLGAAGSTFEIGKHGKQADGFTPMKPVELHSLIKRHPRGQLFNLDTEGLNGSSSSGDDHSAFEVHISRKSFPSASVAALLQDHFPGSRQVIFLPLYDPTSSKWQACFVWNTYSYHDLTQNPDFLFCIAFANCVMTEIGRIATIAADQQKSDFIGSISHELRSPLHGILASMEFLHDTDTTSFQQSLIGTAEGCAHTLLDTINMVLDYSRLNSFERNANKARRRGRRTQLPASFGGSSDGLQAQLNIYGDVDLAAITEEVVEGVSTGQVFKDITTIEGDDVPNTQRKLSTPQISLGDTGIQETVPVTKPEVNIIIDVKSRPAGWSFVTQPGAFRRIVMNLFGNSLKYTKQGSIVVQLEAEDVDKSAGTGDVATWVTLKVSDTGKGISPEYMRNKLFTPFAQESSINPGTGLGLSLVKGIVNMLNGEINVKSTVGVGTDIIVKLPMSSTLPMSTATPSSAGSSIERTKDDSIPLCRAEAVGKTAALFWNSVTTHSSAQTKAANLQRQTLSKYFREWFGFADVIEWKTGTHADIVAVDETDLKALLEDIYTTQTYSKAGSRPMILVFCGTASRLALTKQYENAGVTIEFLCIPVGPYKLARTLRLEFEAQKRMSSSDPFCEEKPLDSSNSAAYLASAMEHVTITSANPGTPVMHLLKQGAIIANTESNNAKMALGTPPISAHRSTGKEEDSFPFPTDAAVNGIGNPSSESFTVPSDITDRPLSTIEEHRSNFEAQETLIPTWPEPAAQESLEPTQTSASAHTTPNIQLITPIPTSTTPRLPRLLLVDDNPVNLRLLSTFMRRRKYEDIVSAQDGAQAVCAFRAAISRSPPEPPDIIFMDISMPVLDGFAATRQIREIEAELAKSLGPMETPPPSLVIALTGLASGRDQSDAFLSGFDVYLTKPVSFREVGRLLDNWQANGGAGAATVPHGSLHGNLTG